MPATMASGWDRVRVWSSGISSAGANARALDIWLGAVVGVVWGTLLGGVSGAAGFAVAYGVLLRAWRVHRAVLSCAGTTWVLGSAALRLAIPRVGTLVPLKVRVVVGVKPSGGYEVFLSSAGSGFAFPSVLPFFVSWTSCRWFGLTGLFLKEDPLPFV